ncbi:hypothetical protein BH09MYX1_BH09MYX1_44770 [soil metagenome]
MSRLNPATVPTTMWGTFKRHLPAYLLGTVVLAGFQLSMNRIDWFAKRAIDTIFGDDPAGAWRPASFILGLAVIAFVARVASRYFMFNAGRDVEYELRALLLHRLHQLGSAFYRKISAGEIMSRATNDLGQVRLLYGFGVLNVVNVLFAFASALQIMLAISVRLTLASFVMLPLIVIFTRSFSRQMFVRTRANQEALGRLSSIAQANLAGIRVVRSFALEERELTRFRKVNKEYLDVSLGLARLRGAMIPVLGATSAISVLVFFLYGASLLLVAPEAGGITKGGFFAFQAALARMTWPIIALGFSLSIVQRGRACFVRLQEIFDEKPEIVDGTKLVQANAGRGLRVEGLSFAYGKRKVLDGVDFSVPPGKSLAIVGKTGSGKSTLALLLARLLPTPPGRVFIDETDICDMRLADLRSILGYAQ